MSGKYGVTHVTLTSCLSTGARSFALTWRSGLPPFWVNQEGISHVNCTRRGTEGEGDTPDGFINSTRRGTEE